MTEVNRDAEDLRKERAALNQDLDRTVAALTQAAAERERRAARLQQIDVALKAVSAVVSVAAPALVTYAASSQLSGELKLSAVLLAALAGVIANIQAVFRFQPEHVSNALDALELDEVRSQLEAAGQNAEKLGAVQGIRPLSDAIAIARHRLTEITVTRRRDRLLEARLRNRSNEPAVD